MNGFYKFSVKFADGNENEAHGFVYASTYISAMEKVEDLVSDEDIISINLEGMEPGDTLLMPEWIADKVYNYDYYTTDYKMDNKSTWAITEKGEEVLKRAHEDKNVQLKDVDSLPTAAELSKCIHAYDSKPTPPFENDEVMKEIHNHLTNGNYGPSDKLPLSQQSIDYISECVNNGLPIEMPNHRGDK